jgi:FkbM family methyltransferase
LGAYIGLSALYFRTHFPDALIICVEPSPDNFAVLTKNLAPYTNIVTINAGVWGRNTALSIYEVFDGHWGTRITNKKKGKVRSITMNQIAEICGILQGSPRIDLLKMDIEGSERSVFTHNTEWIDLVDCCAVELHDRFFDGCRMAFEGLFSKDVFDIRQESEITIARRHG